MIEHRGIVNRQEQLRDWVRQHDWGNSLLVDVEKRFSEAFELLQKQHDGYLTVLSYSQDSVIAFLKTSDMSIEDIYKWIGVQRNARAHLDQAQQAFPGLRPRDLLAVLSSVAAHDLDEVVRQKLNIFDEHYWPFALALAFLALEGDIDRLRASYENDLRDLNIERGLFDDERWYLSSPSEVLAQILGANCEDLRQAERLLFAAAKSGRVASVGRLLELSARTGPLTPLDWIDMVLRLDPRDGKLKFMGTGGGGPVWGKILFESTNVRGLIKSPISSTGPKNAKKDVESIALDELASAQRAALPFIRKYKNDTERWRRGEIAKKPLQKTYAHDAGYSPSRFCELIKEIGHLALVEFNNSIE